MRSQSKGSVLGIILVASVSLARALDASTVDSLCTLPLGARIRVEAPLFAPAVRTEPWLPIVGTFVRAEADTLIVQEIGSGSDNFRLLAIPTSSIERLERWRGKKGNGRYLAAVGFAIGAVAGLATDVEPGGFVHSRAAQAVGGGLAGALWGSILGSQIKTDRWGEVQLSPEGTRRTLGGGVRNGSEP